ncbi:F-box protein SKIP19-like protein [Tanacetum coccineum]
MNCSSKLQTLSLRNCYSITSSGLSLAVKNLPQLENLHLYYISIHVEDIEIIGSSCPNLRSFKLNKEFRRRHIECDGDAIAIANTMPELRHLQLFGNKMTNDGLQAILHNCPHLESLDVRRCSNLNLSGSLAKLCKERIKDFKRPNDSTENCGFNQVHGYDDFDDMYSSGYSDVYDYSEDEFYEDYEFSDGSSLSAPGPGLVGLELSLEIQSMFIRTAASDFNVFMLYIGTCLEKAYIALTSEFA